MIKKLGRFFYNLLVILVLLILFMNIWQLISQRFLHTELPSVLGYSYLIVLSGSMEPEISAGDILVIHEEESYTQGDVIAFHADGMLISHRIEQETPKGFVTRGDANNIADENPVGKGQIVGKAVLVIPKVGRAILFLRTPLGFMIFVLLGGAMVLLPERKK